ncbi:MAG TPA: hypothetical protein VF321_05830, partial [Gaiellaceae bacterium]
MARDAGLRAMPQNQANFLLAAGAIIPILVVAVLVEMRSASPPEGRPPSTWTLSRVRSLQVKMTTILAAVVAIAGYGEWICLR